MDRVQMRAIEITLRDAASRGALDQADVDAAVDRMWGAVAKFKEAQKAPQDKESQMAAAIEEFNEASADVVGLLNRAASG
jgi:hypothetical protein